MKIPRPALFGESPVSAWTALAVVLVVLSNACAPAPFESGGEASPDFGAGSGETPNGVPVEENTRFTSDVRIFEGSGETVWADGFEGELIKGLDGSEYLPYTGAAIEQIQGLLRTRGLYSGPVNGVLDLPTMKAIAGFQEATLTLQVCGIPTPRTRQMLRQGSHTI